jgi:hypothetical protein
MGRVRFTVTTRRFSKFNDSSHRLGDSASDCRQHQDSAKSLDGCLRSTRLIGRSIACTILVTIGND